MYIASSKGIRNRHCSICNIAFMERYIYLDHELHSHKTKGTPVIDLYTLRCDICKKRYISPQRYRQHMADLNNIQIPIITPEPKSNMSITPDAKDPNNYCSSCNSTFTSQLLYSEHMIKVHHMSRLISSNIKPTIEFVTASLTFFWMIQSFLSLVFFIKNIIALLTIIF
ncbi:hypothetical protein EDC94DRAFT_23696 [Helicostylum pulchrum]|nr:hypothetical protein EDC94DRAFT_23696 [Helicostylum pulchrum]